MMVKDWKAAWRWHSTQAFTFIALAPLVWMELPPTAQEYVSSLVPAEYHPLIITVVALAGIIGRLRDQGGAQ
jgi:hypothetical protein